MTDDAAPPVRQPGVSWATSPAVRHTMQANPGRDTKPEVAVRRLLHRRGLRYRVHHPVPGNRRRTIDIAFTRLRLACFIDGCFWHGCPAHFVSPKSNVGFWERKRAENSARDAETNRLLERAGWQVLRFWEHDGPELIAAEIERTLLSRQRALCGHSGD